MLKNPVQEESDIESDYSNRTVKAGNEDTRHSRINIDSIKNMSILDENEVSEKNLEQFAG